MEYLNLTNAQKRIWYMEKEYFSYPMYNIGGVTIYDEAVDFEKLQRAINYVILQNDNLRLRFFEQNSEPLQYVCEYKYEAFEFFDLTKSETTLEEFIDVHSKTKFTFENGCLYRFILLKLSDNTGGYFINLHHIIADGWAIAVIIEQIRKNYDLLCNNIEIEDEKKPFIQNYLYSEDKYLSSDRYRRDKEFWIDEFKDHSKSKSFEIDTVEGKRKFFNIEQDLYSEIKDFLKQNNISDQVFWTFV